MVSRATARLEANQVRLRALIDQSPLGLFEATNDGQIEYINAVGRKLMGVEHVLVPGEHWATLIHPEERSAALAEWHVCLDRRREFRRELRLAHQGSGVEWAHLTITPLLDANGAVIAHLGTVVDVTSKRKAQDLLRSSEERFGLAVRGSSDGIWDWNLITNQIWFSPMWP